MKLVREYIACMNEVSQLLEISEQKVQRLENLAKSWEEFSQDLVLKENPEVVMTDMLRKRIYWTKRKSENLPRILNDLKGSMDVVSLPTLSLGTSLILFVPSSSNYVPLSKTSSPSSPNPTTELS